jgi:hypothetical protein
VWDVAPEVVAKAYERQPSREELFTMKASG